MVIMSEHNAEEAWQRHLQDAMACCEPCIRACDTPEKKREFIKEWEKNRLIKLNYEKDESPAAEYLQLHKNVQTWMLEAFKWQKRSLLERKTIAVMKDALIWAKEFFHSRDEMNAKVHCAPIRLSPITERIAQALAEVEKMEEGNELHQ